MSDQGALLRAICTDRDDDTARLVYADWLDEHGGTVACGPCRGHGYTMVEGVRKYRWDGTPVKMHGRIDCPACSRSGRVPDGNAARAEFVRVQVELARHPGMNCGTMYCSRRSPEGLCDSCRRFAYLRRRERELLESDRHWEKWSGRPMPVVCINFAPWDGPDGVEYRRGFVEALTCSAADWLAHADRLYWDPRQTVACPECAEFLTLAGRPLKAFCHTCHGSGRVPRAWPGGCHPLREVRLSTPPDTPDIRSFNALRRWVRPLELEGNIGDTFAAEWPGLTFHPPG